jgi:ribonuclease BN (tRNA processing enzyme)
MRLTVVGCAPAYTQRPGRVSSCYLVEHDGRAVVLDLGQGAFSELSRYLPMWELGGLLISHLHADHLVDLVPLRHFLRFEMEVEADRAPVLHGPRDIHRRFDAFQGQDEFLYPLSGDALEPGAFELAGMRVEARHVTHIEDSFAFRLSAADGSGPGLVYSGDCAVAEDLLPLVREGDTLLCEAANGTDPAGGGIHINAAQAAGVASDGRAARLVLTHILDRHAEVRTQEAARQRYGGELFIAEPGMTLDVY